MKRSERSELARSKWRRHIEACLRSGKTVSAWCDSNGISAKQWYYWRQRLVPEKLPARQAQRLIPVRVVSSETKATKARKANDAGFSTPRNDREPSVMRIDIAGVSLHVAARTEIGWLTQLLKALT
jgi:hypothetical protein